MPDGVKISQLPLTNALPTNGFYPIVIGSVTYRIDIALLLILIAGKVNITEYQEIGGLKKFLDPILLPVFQSSELPVLDLPQEGAIIWVTDTKQVNLWNGTAWQPLAGGSGLDQDLAAVLAVGAENSYQPIIGGNFLIADDNNIDVLTNAQGIALIQIGANNELILPGFSTPGGNQDLQSVTDEGGSTDQQIIASSFVAAGKIVTVPAPAYVFAEAIDGAGLMNGNINFQYNIYTYLVNQDGERIYSQVGFGTGGGISGADFAIKVLITKADGKYEYTGFRILILSHDYYADSISLPSGIDLQDLEHEDPEDEDSPFVFIDNGSIEWDSKKTDVSPDNYLDAENVFNGKVKLPSILQKIGIGAPLTLDRDGYITGGSGSAINSDLQSVIDAGNTAKGEIILRGDIDNPENIDFIPVFIIRSADENNIADLLKISERIDRENDGSPRGIVDMSLSGGLTADTGSFGRCGAETFTIAASLNLGNSATANINGALSLGSYYNASGGDATPDEYTLFVSWVNVGGPSQTNLFLRDVNERSGAVIILLNHSDRRRNIVAVSGQLIAINESQVNSFILYPGETVFLVARNGFWETFCYQQRIGEVVTGTGGSNKYLKFNQDGQDYWLGPLATSEPV